MLSVAGARMPTVKADELGRVLVRELVRAEGTADGDADPADRRRPAGPARPGPGPRRELRRAGHGSRRHSAGRGGDGTRLGDPGGREHLPRGRSRAWGRSGRAVRGRGAARHPASHPGRATADRRRRAVPGRSRGPRAPPRARRRPHPAPRGRRPRRRRRPSAARRPDPHRPLRRRRRPSGRPRRLPPALRGHGRRRRPRLGGRPRLHERHEPGRHPRGHAPGPVHSGGTTEDR